MKKTLFTALLAAVAMTGQAQTKVSLNGTAPADAQFVFISNDKQFGNPDSVAVTDEKCQSETAQPVVSDAPDVLPNYPGGDEALMKYLSKNVKYPKLASKYCVEGRVLMNFTVDKDGSVKDISAKNCKIENFNTTKFNQETKEQQAQLKEQFALLFAQEGARVIRKMTKWTPATKNGEPVSHKYTLPIHFVIPNK